MQKNPDADNSTSGDHSPESPKRPLITRRECLATGTAIALILVSRKFIQYLQDSVDQKLSEPIPRTPESNTPNPEKEHSPHEIMLQILSSLPHNPSQAPYRSFHPLGATDKESMRPLYVVPYALSNPRNLITEHYIYCIAGSAYTNSVIEKVYIAGLPGKTSLSTKMPEKIAKQPMTFKEYEQLVQNTPSELYAGEQIQLCEILLRKLPGLKIHGAEMIHDEDTEKAIQKSAEEIDKLKSIVGPIIDYYVGSIIQKGEEPDCSLMRGSDGTIDGALIGDKVFADFTTLIDALNRWVYANEITAGFYLHQAQKLAEDNTLKESTLFILHPDILRYLETEGPAEGRSVFMPNAGGLNHRAMQPMSFDEIRSRIKSLARKLENLEKLDQKL